jgi:hypothetical protein
MEEQKRKLFTVEDLKKVNELFESQKETTLTVTELEVARAELKVRNAFYMLGIQHDEKDVTVSVNTLLWMEDKYGVSFDYLLLQLCGVCARQVPKPAFPPGGIEVVPVVTEKNPGY